MSIFRLSPIECTRQQHPYILRLYDTDALLSFIPFSVNGQIRKFQLLKGCRRLLIAVCSTQSHVKGCRLLFPCLRVCHAHSPSS